MTAAARERVVEVVVTGGTGPGSWYRYGSGFRLGGRLVLTAAHVVEAAAAGEIAVRGPDKVHRPARAVDGLAGDPGTADLALLELGDEVPGLPPVPVAVIDRDSPVPAPVEGCWAVGYPQFQDVGPAGEAVRETAEVWGKILPAENLAGGLLSLQVEHNPRTLPAAEEKQGESQWSGMSGAGVLVGERLIGVISEHAPRRGNSMITVTPLTSLDRLPNAADWWARLGVDPGQLVTLSARGRAEEPDYRAMLRQLRPHPGELRDREEELQAIRSFACGRDSVLAPPGSQYALLAGDPWGGKTALLAEAVHTLPPEVDCVAYFLRRVAGDADRAKFLAVVVPQLAVLLGTDRPAPDEYVFRRLWQQAAQRAADEGRHLLLMVDGLDEDERPGGHSVAGLLPDLVPGLSARVLATSRLGRGLPNDVHPAHPLAALTPDGLYILADSPYAGHQRDLANQEIDWLLGQPNDDLTLDVLGLLTAARGGLTIADLVRLTAQPKWKVRQVLDGQAAHTLKQDRSTDVPRYTFAHETLLARCHGEGVGERRHEDSLHEWAAEWRGRHWPTARDGKEGTPLYLLDRYPQLLYADPAGLAALAGDADWVTAAIQGLGVDAVLAELRTAITAVPGEPWLAATYAIVRQQAHHLRTQDSAADPAFVPRQLCLQAAETGEAILAAGYRNRQRACDDPGPVLQWTSQRTSPALILELGHGPGVATVAILPDGRVVTGGSKDGRIRMRDPAKPDADPVELSGSDEAGARLEVSSMAVLPDGRVVTGSNDGRVLMRDPAEPDAGPVELGRHGPAIVCVAVLPDGRVVSSGAGGGQVLVHDPAEPDAAPVELGRHEGGIGVAVLADGRVATGSGLIDGRVLVYDPAKPGAAPVELRRIEPLRPGRRSLNSLVAVAALPDGRVVTGGGYRDGRVLVWDPAEPGADPVELGRHGSGAAAGMAAMAVLSDGRVVTGGGGDGRVLIWDPAEPGAGPVELGRHEPEVESGMVAVAVAAAPDGRVVTGGFRDGRVLIWDPGAAQRGPVRPRYHGAGVTAMAVLSDGRLATGGGTGDGRVLVWDPAEPDAAPLILGRLESMVTAAAPLPDGRVVTFTGMEEGHAVLIWDPAKPGAAPVSFTGRLGPPWGPYVTAGAAATLPDGRVVTGHGMVLVWDPAEPGTDPVRLDEELPYAQAVAVMPDGRVVTGGDDGRVLVWDPAEPDASPVELGCHGATVTVVAVLPDGRVVTGGDDGRVLVWDPAEPDARPVQLDLHGAWVTAMAVLPDGRVVTGHTGRRVVLQHVQGDSPPASLACSVGLLAAWTSPSVTRLFIVHGADGISCWEIDTAR